MSVIASEEFKLHSSARGDPSDDGVPQDGERVEYAAYSHLKCSALDCHDSRIAVGALRFGQFKGLHFEWYHWECSPQKQSHKWDPATLGGFDVLSDSDKERVATAVKAGLPAKQTLALQRTNSVTQPKIVPSLPTELWRQILSHAVDYDQLFDTSFASHFDLEEDYDVQDYDIQSLTTHLDDLVVMIRQSRSTALVLLSVSKTFGYIARDLLFEFLYISKLSQAKLLTALVSSDTPLVGSTTPPGRLVRGICLRFDSGDVVELEARMRAIIRSCPNLIIFRDRSHFSTWRDSRNGIVSLPACIESLAPQSRIKLVSQRGTRSPTLVTLIDHTALQSLQFLSLESVGDGREPPDNSVGLSFPYLHTLMFGASWAGHHIGIASWNLPRFRNAIVQDTSQNRSILPIFKAHGAKLVTLQFRCTVNSDDLRNSLLACTQLEDLTLRYNFVPANLAISLKRLRRLGIGCDPSESFDVAGNNMGTSEPYPVLEVVRLYKFPKVLYNAHTWSRRRKHQWDGWIRAWTDRGVRFEDSEGDLVQFPYRMSVEEDSDDGRLDLEGDYGDEYYPDYGSVDWSGSDELDSDQFDYDPLDQYY